MTARPAPWRRRGIAAGLTSIVLVGALGAGAAVALPGFSFSQRTGGLTRVETAVASSQALYDDGAAPDVVLVNLAATVDGLSASYLAGLKNAPILYTDVDAMPKATADEVKRLGAKRVWLVGGEGVISASQQQGLAKTYTVQRFAGNDRYETAAAVATAGQNATGADKVYQPERIYVTSGESLADAVVVGPIAWADNYPILLTRAGSVPKATSDALAALGTTNRQSTAVLVADDAVATADFTHGNAALVGGRDSNAVDALSASALAGATGTPLLYIKGNDEVGSVTANYLKANRTELTPDSLGFVFGGTSAVTDKAVSEAEAAAQ